MFHITLEEAMDISGDAERAIKTIEDPILHLLELPVEVIEATAALLPTEDRLQFTSSCKRLHELGRPSTRVWAGLIVVLRSVAQGACFLRWLGPRRLLLSSLSLSTKEPLSVPGQPAAHGRSNGSNRSSSGSGSYSPTFGTTDNDSTNGDSEQESDSDDLGPRGPWGGARGRWGTDEEEELELARVDDTCQEQFLLGALAGIPLTSLHCSFQQGYSLVQLGGMLGAALPSLRKLHVAAADVQDCLSPGLLALTVVCTERRVAIPRCIARSSCAPQLRELCLVGWSAQEGGSEQGSYEASEEEEEEASEGGEQEEGFCCTGLQRLTALTRLQLRAGKLKEVPRQLLALQQLQELCLSGNFRGRRVPQLGSLSVTTAADAEGLARLAELPALTKLHLSSCDLDQLPPVLPPSLKVLNVTGNPRINLSALPTSGCPLEELVLGLSVATRNAAHLSSLSTLRRLTLGHGEFFSWLYSRGLAALLCTICTLPRLECVWGQPQDLKLISANEELESLILEARGKGVRFVSLSHRRDLDF